MLCLNSPGLVDHSKPSECIPRITSNIDYDTFFRQFMEANKPCIFSNALITKDWQARTDWVTSDGAPDVEHLLTNYGQSEVPVADCATKEYDAQQKETLTLQDYIGYWRRRRGAEGGRCLYLKDWHFVKAYPEQTAYRTPEVFASDWLNEFWQGRQDYRDDYRFLYLGPQGSWTPFHCDVFQSYSWSANICGRKKWVFYAPGEEDNLKDSFGNLAYDVTSTELSNRAQYPRGGASSGGVTVVQEAGETLFVPSGWHHQVWNLEDTLSINHNWINATNISNVWTALVDAVEKVQRSIADCASMDKWGEQCQLLLKATHGMDFLEYYKLLQAIGRRRTDALSTGDDVVVLDGHRQNKNHTLYDLTAIRRALELLVDDPRIDELESFEQLSEHPTKLLDDIILVL